MTSQFILKDSQAGNLTSERLKVSPQSLSPIELIKAALGISKGKAEKLMALMGADDLYHPLAALRELEADTLKAAGLTDKEVERAIAVLQLSRRLYSTRYDAALPLESPEAVVAYLSADLMWESREKFVVLLLDVRNRPIGKFVASVGTATETLADPKIIFGKALKAGATRMIVAHNHPSGSTDPSPEDLALTKQLLEGAKFLDIQLLDHLVLGLGSFTSIRQHSDMWY